MGRQVLGAATFSYNWLAVADGTDYFAATAPELFRNFWSLAVEEQFYVLWPLLLPLVLLIPGRWSRVALMLVAAGGSAWWMSQLVAAGEVTRAYFGTDAHAFGLLLGIALALAIANMPEKTWMLSRTARTASLLVGTVGIAAIVAAALLPETSDAATFPGSLLLATIGIGARRLRRRVARGVGRARPRRAAPAVDRRTVVRHLSVALARARAAPRRRAGDRAGGRGTPCGSGCSRSCSR